MNLLDEPVDFKPMPEPATISFTPRFPLVLDATSLSVYKSCRRKSFFQTFNGLTAHAPSIHLMAGAAFARGLEVARKSYYNDGDSIPRSIIKGIGALITAYGDSQPAGTYKSLENMIGALDYYLTEFPLDSDPVKPLKLSNGKAAIEFRFAIPLEILHPETGEPILYCGRFDYLGQHQDTLFVVDEKTTSQMGPQWAKQWALRSQYLGYVWAAGQFDYKVGGAITRGICIRKDNFECAQVISQTEPWLIDEWYSMTHELIEEMIECWKTSKWRPNYDAACTSYGSCQFMDLCKVQEPQLWLDNYINRFWNPLETIE